jgi:site-specific DNA-methyltransferase (cytosine-N4-specific)
MTRPYFQQDGSAIYQGHVLEVLKSMEAGSVHCVVTSPPYW